MDIFGLKISRNRKKTDSPQAESEDMAELRNFKAEIKRQELKMKLAEQQLEHKERMMDLQDRIQEMQERMFGDDDDSGGGNVENMLMQFIMQKGMQQQGSQPLNTQHTPPPTPAAVSISEEQLQEYWKSLPRIQRKMAKMASDEQIGALLRDKVKNIDDDSIKRAIELIRND
jgi:hypothetical protein